MNTFLKSTLIGSALFVGISLFTVAHADTSTLSDGTNNANVAVNGTIGADNTDPTAPIPEGSDKWLNITLDTATIFYNTQTDTNIVSPKYQITNNSGRPVSVKVNSFTQNDNVAIDSIGSLNVNMNRKGTSSDTSGSSLSTNLISNGAISNFSTAGSLSLANKSGQIKSTDTDGSFSNQANFDYTGNVISKLSSTLQPSFTMNLLFTPISWAN